MWTIKRRRGHHQCGQEAGWALIKALPARQPPALAPARVLSAFQLDRVLLTLRPSSCNNNLAR